ncbi:hypothetical protein [Apilactobacillus micheneri]|uniref:hypothetical protein n=1 Tax=Apilactobacillus micheneri TaxID=1899430 RepID=UPI0011287C79|nr:hypothetical protein [Apilactobacillus micheneri]TPR40436.1 hypothetical protein DY119_01730 [Apilactobacillus micheneri]
MSNKNYFLTKKEYKESLSQQFKLLRKASVMAIQNIQFDQLPGLTTAMIKSGNEIFKTHTR